MLAAKMEKEKANVLGWIRRTGVWAAPSSSGGAAGERREGRGTVEIRGCWGDFQYLFEEACIDAIRRGRRSARAGRKLPKLDHHTCWALSVAGVNNILLFVFSFSPLFLSALPPTTTGCAHLFPGLQASKRGKMSGVDYSKWDKMASEMSDSDEENGNHPEVTTFDEPQSVTFGGPPDSEDNEGRDHPSNTNSPSNVAAPIDGSAGGASAAAAGNAATAAPRPKAQAPISDEQLAENGAAVWGDADGGGRVLHCVWRQARAEVTVVVPVPPGTRAGDVEVSLSAKPETIAEGVADLIRVSVKKAARTGGGDGGASGAGADAAGQKKGAGLRSSLLEGELAFQAKLDAEGEGQVDWELKDYPGTIVARDSAMEDGEKEGAGSGDRRGVEVVLRKHCPVPNAAVWWKSLLKGEPEIDVSAIKGRATNNHQSVWEEALGMFKEKVAARKSHGKISVEMGEEG